MKEQNQQLHAQGRLDSGPVDALQMAAGEQVCSRDLEDTELTPAERDVVDTMHTAAGQESQRTARPGILRTCRPPRGGKCTRCGHTPHPPGARCPAANAICRRCNRKGHYQDLFFSNTTVPTHEVTLDNAFLGAVEDEENTRQWCTTLWIGEKPVDFKLDTGAQVTAISEQTYK